MQLTEKLIDRLLDVYIQSDSDLQIVKSQLEIILYDYDVRPKETAIVPYGKTRNEVLMKRFAVAKAVAGRSPRTIEVYLQAVGLFLRTIQKNADEVRSEDIQVYIAQLMTKGRTKTYCNDVRRFLSSFYTYLTKEEIITRNPIDRVEAIKCKLCKRVAEREGVQGAHAHRFRRTCATFALRRGMSIEMVSMMLGHEELSTTQIYLDVRESDLQIAHEKYVF